ncbi:MAG: DUF6476 family protein [Pseudomonadota bacterium]
MDENDAPDEGTLRFLKTLVTVLTVTMIVGLATIVGLFVMRFSAADNFVFPDSITLPDGIVAEAFTQTATWYAVVTADDEILVFSRATGALVQRIDVNTD